MDSISAIGGGMQGMMGMQGIQDFQAVQGSKDMKEIQGLDNENKQAKPEGMLAQGLNQQDKTEMSDEVQANNPFSENKDIDVGKRIQEEAKAKAKEDISNGIKKQIEAVLDKQKPLGIDKMMPGQKDARIDESINSFKNNHWEHLKNQDMDPSVREAAELLIQRDLDGAAQLINYDGKKDAFGLSQGEQEGSKGSFANNIIAGIQGMGQIQQ